MAKTDEINVAAADIPSVSTILRLTSGSLIVSKSPGALTERNIPASGAKMNSNATAPRSIKAK